MSEKKMWGGRFKEPTSALVEAFTESVSFDKALYREDIAGSKAHAAMLAHQGVLTDEEGKALIKGLNQVLQEIESGTFVWRSELEDVHMNIESRLTEIVGDVGKKLHTGRSRNDQVALDFRLHVSNRIGKWQECIAMLIDALTGQAAENVATLLPGCTHMQAAQPVSLGQHLMAYAWMLRRDSERLADCNKRVKVCPLGAAALAGTTYPVDPAFVAAELGFEGIFKNSMDAVSDRDFVLEALFCGSTIMTHLSRLCEDIILWANPAFGFVRLPDAYSTGSSIMPQKKNPDVAELVRGKAGRVYGSLVTMLTIIKGLPMTYNRDLQEDKEPFMDADRTVSHSLEVMAGMMRHLNFNKDRMLAALKRGFLNATELADYLVGKGIPFREAHHLTGAAVALAEERGVGLEDLDIREFKSISPFIEGDVYKILDYTVAVSRRESSGGTGPQSVWNQIREMEEWIKEK